MKTDLIRAVAAATFAIASIAACDRPRSPQEMQASMAKTEAQQAKKVADAEADALSNVASAEQKVARAQTDVEHQVAKGNEKISLANAEADHRVALQACEPLAGDDRRDCRKSADEAYDQERTSAKTAEQLTDPRR